MTSGRLDGRGIKPKHKREEKSCVHIKKNR